MVLASVLASVLWMERESMPVMVALVLASVLVFHNTAPVVLASVLASVRVS